MNVLIENKLTEEQIKNFDSKEYQQHREKIREYYFKHNPKIVNNCIKAEINKTRDKIKKLENDLKHHYIILSQFNDMLNSGKYLNNFKEEDWKMD